MSLERVTDRSRRAMRVHIADGLGAYFGIANSIAHHAESAFVFRSGLRDVIGVGRHAIANDFRNDGSSAPPGMLKLLKNKNACAFADDKAIAPLIPRATGLLWIIIARGKRAHRRESTNAHASDGSFRAASDHHVGIAILNDAEGITHGMRTGGTSCRRGLVRSLGSVAHGNLSRRQIDNRRRNEKRRYLPRAALHQCGVFALDDIESTDPGANVHADTLIIFGSDLEAGALDGFIRGGKRQMDEASHFLDFFFLDVVQRVEVLDLGGDPAGKVAGVEPRDGTDTALSCQ